ncbi:MAG: hypothetical protein U1D00_21475 [Mycobacterium sp.]|nr:hypothetical protein [Mycobacterium sp.]
MSRGDALIGVTRDERYGDRMRGVLVLTDTSGCEWRIDLKPAELRGLVLDAVKLLTADPREIRSWWRRLTDEDASGAGAPAAPPGASTGCTADNNGRPA